MAAYCLPPSTHQLYRLHGSHLHIRTAHLLEHLADSFRDSLCADRNFFCGHVVVVVFITACQRARSAHRSAGSGLVHRSSSGSTFAPGPIYELAGRYLIIHFYYFMIFSNPIRIHSRISKTRYDLSVQIANFTFSYLHQIVIPANQVTWLQSSVCVLFIAPSRKRPFRGTR